MAGWAAPVAGELVSTAPGHLQADGEVVVLRDLQLARLRLTESRYSATPGMPDLLDAVLILSGEVGFSSSRGRRSAGPGTLAFARPTRGDVMEIRAPSTLVWVTVPSESLRADLLPESGLPMLTVPPSITVSFAGVVGGLVDGLDLCLPESVTTFRDTVLNVVSAALREARTDRRAAEGDSLAARAREHIDASFVDPALRPESVANALGVSVRTLHSAFEPEDLSVARYIRFRRISEVRHAILAGSTDGTAALARRFGFSSSQRLARGYEQIHGHSIEEERRLRRCLRCGPRITTDTAGRPRGTPGS
jgi:AraC-like DNA-binding protein